MTIMAEFGAYLSAMQAEDDGVVDALGLHLADTVGAQIACVASAEARTLIAYRQALPEFSGAADGDLFSRIALHCALARASEADDIHLASMTTPGSIVVPCALMMLAEPARGEERAAAAALLCGYEAMTRLGRVVDGPTILYRGIWPTYFTAGFAAAAVAARLLGLDAVRTAHALALALKSAAPSVGNSHGASRWWLIGEAVRSGVAAALAARGGVGDDGDVLQSRLLPDVYGIAPRTALLLEDRGEAALAGVSFKPWCAARQTMPATQALLDLLARGLRVEEIEQITAHVLPPHLQMIAHGVRAGDRAAHLTSLPYQMAVAALAPDRQLDLFPGDRPVAPAVAAFMDRIAVVPDDTLMADYPSRWPARVTVKTGQGERGLTVTEVPGDPGRPLTEAALKEKFHRLVAAALPPARAEELWQQARHGLRRPGALSGLALALDRVVAQTALRQAGR